MHSRHVPPSILAWQDILTSASTSMLNFKLALLLQPGLNAVHFPSGLRIELSGKTQNPSSSAPNHTATSDPKTNFGALHLALLSGVFAFTWYVQLIIVGLWIPTEAHMLFCCLNIILALTFSWVIMALPLNSPHQQSSPTSHTVSTAAPPR